YRGATLRPRLLSAINTRSCSAHYSLIVGRRKTGSSCQYLIRNSHGIGFWTDQWECMCERTDGASPRFEDCRKERIVSGESKVVGCWVDRDDVGGNLYDLMHF